jgi:hypothetical protein
MPGIKRTQAQRDADRKKVLKQFTSSRTKDGAAKSAKMVKAALDGQVESSYVDEAIKHWLTEGALAKKGVASNTRYYRPAPAQTSAKA